MEVWNDSLHIYVSTGVVIEDHGVQDEICFLVGCLIEEFECDARFGQIVTFDGVHGRVGEEKKICERQLKAC